MCGVYGGVWVYACVHACLRACVCVCVCVRAWCMLKHTCACICVWCVCMHVFVLLGPVLVRTYMYILKVLDLTRKSQSRLHAEIAHAIIATMSLRAFICVHVRLRSFASTVCDRPRALTCAT